MEMEIIWVSRKKGINIEAFIIIYFCIDFSINNYNFIYTFITYFIFEYSIINKKIRRN